MKIEDQDNAIQSQPIELSPPKEEEEVSVCFSIYRFFVQFKIGCFHILLNIILSLYCVGFYIYTTYEPNTVLKNGTIFFLVNFLCRCYFIFDFLIDILVGNVEFSFKDWNFYLIEIASTIPYMFARISVGMKEDLISNAHLITSSFICFRCFKTLELSIFIKTDVNRELYTIMCSIFSLLLNAAILINVIENIETIGKYWLFLPRDCNDNYFCGGANDTFHSSFYFIMTTIAIVGYSSSVSSVIGRIILSVVIILSIIEIPSQCSDLMVLLSSKSSFARATYKKLEGADFILITGNISSGSITVLLQEYFHPDHGENERHALILLPQRPDSNIKVLLQEYPNKLFYLEGDPMKYNDLDRCQFKDAKMIMLLCNKQTDDPAQEDSKTIIQAMAIKKFLSQEDNEDEILNNMPSRVASLKKNITLNKENSSKISYNNNNNNNSINAINNNVGNNNTNNTINRQGRLNTIISANSREDKTINNEILPLDKDDEGSSKLVVQLLKPESEHHFTLSTSKTSISIEQIVCIDELKLSMLSKSCLCPGLIALISNLIITNNFDEGVQEKLGNAKWLDEYKEGKDYEIYKISLDPLRGYKFIECADKIYEAKKTILFGINIESKGDQSNVVLLSPMEFTLPLQKDIAVYGYLLAKDQDDADSIADWAKTQKKPTNLENIEEFSSEVSKSKKRKKKSSNNGPNAEGSLDDNEEDLEEDLEEEEEEFEDFSSEDRICCNSSNLRNLTRVCYTTDKPISKNELIKESIDKHSSIKDHTIICGMNQNVLDFIKPLRARNLPEKTLQTIVILCNEIPDDALLDSISFFKNVFIVQGDPMKRNDLIRAGIRTAKKVILLAPSIHDIREFTMNKKLKNNTPKDADDPENANNMMAARQLSREEEDLLDSKTIFKYNMISKINKDVFCVIELINSKNVIFINNKNRKNNEEYIFIKAGLNIDATPSFAAGEVYYSSIMDNLITQAYYNPSLLSVLRKLILGEEVSNYSDKNNIINSLPEFKSGNLYLIDMPKFLFINMSENSESKNKIKFGKIFKSLLELKVIVIGVYRAGDLKEKCSKDDKEDGHSNSDKSNDKDKEDKVNNSKGKDNNEEGNFESSNVDKNNNNNEKQNNLFYYVVTAPEEDFVVQKIDKLFVISNTYPSPETIGMPRNSSDKKKTGRILNDKPELLKLSTVKKRKSIIKKDFDEEAKVVITEFNKELGVIKNLLDDIKKSMEKNKNDCDKVVNEAIKKKLYNLKDKKKNK